MQTQLRSHPMPHARRARAQLAADLKSLARDAERLLEATAEDLTEQAKVTREQLRGVVEHIKDSYGDWQDHGVATARAAATKADAIVRHNPYESIGTAFGLGLLVGFLLRRR